MKRARTRMRTEIKRCSAAEKDPLVFIMYFYVSVVHEEIPARSSSGLPGVCREAFSSVLSSDLVEPC